MSETQATGGLLKHYERLVLEKKSGAPLPGGGGGGGLRLAFPARSRTPALTARGPRHEDRAPLNLHGGDSRGHWASRDPCGAERGECMSLSRQSPGDSDTPWPFSLVLSGLPVLDRPLSQAFVGRLTPELTFLGQKGSGAKGRLCGRHQPAPLFSLSLRPRANSLSWAILRGPGPAPISSLGTCPRRRPPGAAMRFSGRARPGLGAPPQPPAPGRTRAQTPRERPPAQSRSASVTGRGARVPQTKERREGRAEDPVGHRAPCVRGCAWPGRTFEGDSAPGKRLPRRLPPRVWTWTSALAGWGASAVGSPTPHQQARRSGGRGCAGGGGRLWPGGQAAGCDVPTSWPDSLGPCPGARGNPLPPSRLADLLRGAFLPPGFTRTWLLRLGAHDHPRTMQRLERDLWARVSGGHGEPQQSG